MNTGRRGPSMGKPAASALPSIVDVGDDGYELEGGEDYVVVTPSTGDQTVTIPDIGDLPLKPVTVVNAGSSGKDVTVTATVGTISGSASKVLKDKDTITLIPPSTGNDATATVKPYSPDDVLEVAPAGKPYTTLSGANTEATSGDLILLWPGTYGHAGQLNIPAGVDIKGMGYPIIQQSSGVLDHMMSLGGGQYIEGVKVDIVNGAASEWSAFTVGNVDPVVLKDIIFIGSSIDRHIDVAHANAKVSCFNIVDQSAAVVNNGIQMSAGYVHVDGWYVESGGSDDDYFEATGGTLILNNCDLSRGGYAVANSQIRCSSATVEARNVNCGAPSGLTACVYVDGTSPVFRGWGVRARPTGGSEAFNVASATADVRLWGCDFDEEHVTVTAGAYILHNDRPIRTLCTTTDATPTDLSYGGLGAAYIVIPSGKLVTIAAIVTAKRTDSVGEVMAWRVEATLLNNGGTTTEIDSTVTEIANSGALTWTLTGDVNDSTIDTFRLTFTGEAAKTIKVICDVYEYSEI